MSDRDILKNVPTFTTNYFIPSTITTFPPVRNARMGRPGCFTNDLMHSQIVNNDDNEDDNDGNIDYDHDVMMMIIYNVMMVVMMMNHQNVQEMERGLNGL